LFVSGLFVVVSLPGDYQCKLLNYHTMENNYSHPHNKGFLWGGLLILAGVVLLGINFGYFSASLKNVIFTWPVILIVIGIVHFFRCHFFNGSVLFIIGVFFLIPKIITTYPELFPGLGSDFVQLYWPILLIAAGILLFLRLIFRPEKRWRRHCRSRFRKHIHTCRNENAGSKFSKTRVFGKGEYIVLDPVFYGGEIDVVFGGVLLDLRKTTLPEGMTYLNLDNIFGGIVIHVPDNWNIDLHLDSVFGGASDNRTAENRDTSRTLVIVGDCVFGGIEINS
jgi:predicted membrane protein